MCKADAIWPARLRRVVRAALRHWGWPDLVETAELLLSELATNALRYGNGNDVGVRLYLSGGKFVMEVRDGSSQRPVLRHAAHTEKNGRGLFLVDAMADAWGVSEDGTRTWCSLSLRPAPGDVMQPTAVSAPVTREWSTSLPPTANSVRLACVDTRTRLTQLQWNGNIHGASEIVRRLMANALEQGVDDHGQDLRLRLAITETGELLTEVSDANPSFPGVSADEGRRGRGLWEVRQLGAHVTWYMLPGGGKTVQARVKAGEVPV
ncbi:ATP-binding protein [Streptomyces flavidovirens]